MKTITNVIHPAFALFALVCLVFLPRTQAACLDGCDNGLFNVWQGDDALLNDTTGAGNTAFGWRALFAATDGSFNTGIGGGALVLNNGSSNTAVGAAALLLNTSGTENTAVGTDALVFNDIGGVNTALGAFALFNNTEGDANTATGDSALQNNLTGSNNTADGSLALSGNTTGSQNTAIGDFTLPANNGDFNTAVGNNALASNTTGSGNIALGFAAGIAVTDANSVITIGTGGANVNNSCFIGNIRDVQTQNADAIAVVVDSAGQLGTISSSQRFKTDIRPMNKASEAVLALNPVTFHYKKDKTDTPQFGLIAEDVAAVNPNLVVRDKEGEVYTVRYEAVNAMLLNEFLKEHRKNEQQRKDFEAALTRQQKQIEALTAGLQRVSAQIELSKRAPQTVSNIR
jgi:hypothetical protein